MKSFLFICCAVLAICIVSANTASATGGCLNGSCQVQEFIAPQVQYSIAQPVIVERQVVVQKQFVQQKQFVVQKQRVVQPVRRSRSVNIQRSVIR